MNLHQLRYFALLAKNGHFRKTAEQLCIAQPSLSHSIALLERELGVSLFEKQGRRSVLTPEGSQFLTYVEKSLEILDQGILDMKHLSMGEGIIKLGFLRTLGMDLIPEMIHNFLEIQKEKAIQFKLHTSITAFLIDGLKNQKYDIVFCTNRENEPNIEFIPVSRQDLVVIVPENHPLSNRHAINLEELAPYPQVYFSHASGVRSIVDSLFEKIHVKPQIAYEIDEDIVIAGLVSKGFGVAVVPYMTDLFHINVKTIQIASPYWERNIYMATMKTHHLTPAVANFHQYICREYAMMNKTLSP